MSHTTTTLVDLATEHPDALGVFMDHRIDFCCGGTRSLAEACRAEGLDPDQLLAEIEAAERTRQRPAVRWDERPLPELIEHIVTTYHEPLRRELSVLIEGARTVERVHGFRPSCPHGLARHLEGIRSAVESHLDKEERGLFPMILAGRGRAALMPVRVMTEEHEDHGRNLAKLRELTHDYTPPPEACANWASLYRGLARLEAELMEHIHLENNILFPRALTE